MPIDPTSMTSVARWVILAGVVLLAIGGVMLLVEKTGLPLGRLPGDIHIKGERSSFHFPIVTSIILSIVLTVVLNVVAKFFRD
jgi:hypothetical protein